MEPEGPNNETTGTGKTTGIGETTGGTVEMRPGARYRCPTCPTEVVVVKGDGRGRLTCGGTPMFDPAAGDEASSGPSPNDPETAVLLGKRYGDPGDMVEVLCTKAGSGPLVLDGETLSVKAPKPLPASD